ncbi:ALI_collapsed_G0025300.mRNA.1.CDS.1 [Saccharomyces cerevisiae]|nr:ALI_collapsed_G0025300.mRNA.1.CDS.1 [Saccharomyces cerevisiae]
MVEHILVSGITPLPLGEVEIHYNNGSCPGTNSTWAKPVITDVEQPSLGPTLGVKGGAAGGGYSQVIPMDKFSLHLTGDIHAIGAANNLLALLLILECFMRPLKRTTLPSTTD